LNGGFRKTLTIQLWIIPAAARDSLPYLVLPSVTTEEVRTGSRQLDGGGRIDPIEKF
jgi:hypothetical protein